MALKEMYIIGGRMKFSIFPIIGIATLTRSHADKSIFVLMQQKPQFCCQGQCSMHSITGLLEMDDASSTTSCSLSLCLICSATGLVEKWTTITIGSGKKNPYHLTPVYPTISTKAQTDH